MIETGPADARIRLILAHGAGAPMDSPFLDKIAFLLAERGAATTRFEFAYMAARREGKRRAPPRAEKLEGEYEAAVAAVRARHGGQALFIGGKSMGGRVASMIAGRLYAARQICGLVCLGYPFHPPGRPEQLRTGHLHDLACPALIVQGERDPFGNKDEASHYGLSEKIALTWIGDGDHDLGPRGASGFTRAGNLAAAADAAAAFMTANARPAR